MLFLTLLYTLVVLKCTRLDALVAGDVAIVQYNSDNPDNFAFVALVDIPELTEIKFTDRGWNVNNTFRDHEEGARAWTAPAEGVPAGTVVTIYLKSSSAGTASTGTMQVVGELLASSVLSTKGDQILVYQGSESDPAFLYAFNNKDVGWQTQDITIRRSALPPSLVDGYTANALDMIDNAAYDGSVTRGTKAELLSAISNKYLWIRKELEQVYYQGDVFTVLSSSTSSESVPPSLSVSEAPSWQPSRAPLTPSSTLPSAEPSSQPVGIRSFAPTSPSTARTSMEPSQYPSFRPSPQTSAIPSSIPSALPSTTLSTQPPSHPITTKPSSRPTSTLPFPSADPSSQPVGIFSFTTNPPTARTSTSPSALSLRPSGVPSFRVSSTEPSALSSAEPSSQPAGMPSVVPTSLPTPRPSTPPAIPSAPPSLQRVPPCPCRTAQLLCRFRYGCLFRFPWQQ